MIPQFIPKNQLATHKKRVYILFAVLPLNTPIDLQKMFLIILK